MTRYQNDLAWMLDSPELLALSRQFSTHELINRFAVTGNFEFQQTHRLGVYFEQLWQHLTNHCDSIEVIKHNLQVIIDKHTYGEFDSIIYDQVFSKSLHCELAVKFYLQIGQGDQLSDWVGPNLRDRFDNKYQRLFEHQLTLSKQEHVNQWLTQQSIEIDVVKLLTRGRLFYPLKDFMQDVYKYPREVNKEHLKGFWTKWQDFAHLQLSSSIEWYLLPKMYWLSEITADEVSDLKPLDNKTILIHGHNEKYAFQRIQQVVGMRHGKEIMRGFLVTDDWLRKAKERVQQVS